MISGIRTEIVLRCQCSQCGQELEVDPTSSGQYCASAVNFTNAIAIRPCSKCYREARQPARLMAEALSKFAALEEDSQQIAD